MVDPGLGGPAAMAAVLTHALALPEPALRVVRRRQGAGLAERMASLRQRLEHRLSGIDLAPDLAEDIGSLRWVRGLATLIGLSALAISFWPDFSAFDGAPALPLDPAARDELRAQMVMPLALGGDSGRHVGASALVTPLAFAPERTTVQMVATLGQGDSFARMLERAGVAGSDAARAAALVGAVVPPDGIAPGTRFAITLGQRSAPGAARPLEHMAFRARFDLDLAVDRRGGALVLQQKALAVDSMPLRIRGPVGVSLYRSARAAGAPIKAIQQYLETLDAHFGLEGEIGPDDQFDLIVGYKRSAGGESEVGELLYAGLERAGQPVLQLMRWGKDGGFYEAAGIDKPRASLYFPVAGHITSGYGLRRHPLLGYTRMHAGVDFGAPWGSPIYAVSDGIVSFAGRHGGHGNYVRLEHGGGMGTGYGHMSRFAVSNGMTVHAGQVIGYVGSTGLSTGPHLHYEVYQNGHTVNPLTVKFNITTRIDETEAKAFKARMAELKAIRPGAALGSLGPRQAVASAPQASIAGL